VAKEILNLTMEGEVQYPSDAEVEELRKSEVVKEWMLQFSKMPPNPRFNAARQAFVIFCNRLRHNL